MQRSRTTNDPCSRFSLNTAEGRRARDLYESFVAAMGNPTDTLSLSNALAAAELKGRAELSRKSPDVDPDVLVRLENLAHRAERKLGIKPAAAATPPPSLAAWATQAAPVAQDASEASEAPPAVETHHEPLQGDGDATP
jgi:hypothetical protein